MEKLIIIRSGETVLKGKNRRLFEEKLMKSVRRVLKPLGCHSFYLQHNRIYVPIEQRDESPLLKALMKVFGIDLISIAVKIPVVMEGIKEAALNELLHLQLQRGVKTFKVQTKRTDKSFPNSSQEISREIGAYLLKHTEGLLVDVHHPETTIHVEIKESAYIFSDRIRGLGGLPRETNGNAMLLLSGGIDSPVAGWMVARRGVALKAVHFHSYPYTSKQAMDKVKNLARLLSHYCGPIQLFSINLLPFQQEVAEKCPDDEGTILVRRMMTRLAELLATSHECDALITGESLGQVASQTIQSIRVTNEAVSLPVFRPLIAMDKSEIIQFARKIDTYETSILPFEDCCTVFLPKRPVTKPRLDKIVNSEKLIEMEAMTTDLLNSVEVEWVKEPLHQVVCEDALS
ncbi:tRNA uracil 4-sulfurtransferase ThiI [Anoxynatronum buryatiense]|uniref:Probable tRNA sulfurtransferase n=1 Tax=Anoxynatronum buryatiense TaxID=489973 RepID=A0AA45WUV3_9CLOT|nr:tRNA uracil 4-sulfurtransferase ThiI [Anoxynatronum buryatiense]SMP49913.1 thiamine biosynthesis protein ThiI [Anoxynatronum buryatiense]